MRLTEPQRKQLQHAAQNDLGVVTRPVGNGLMRNSWERMMQTLQGAGLVKPYVHGGYEITDAGRAALST